MCFVNRLPGPSESKRLVLFHYSSSEALLLFLWSLFTKWTEEFGQLPETCVIYDKDCKLYFFWFSHSLQCPVGVVSLRSEEKNKIYFFCVYADSACVHIAVSSKSGALESSNLESQVFLSPYMAFIPCSNCDGNLFPPLDIASDFDTSVASSFIREALQYSPVVPQTFSPYSLKWHPLLPWEWYNADCCQKVRCFKSFNPEALCLAIIYLKVLSKLYFPHLNNQQICDLALSSNCGKCSWVSWETFLLYRPHSCLMGVPASQSVSYNRGVLYSWYWKHKDLCSWWNFCFLLSHKFIQVWKFG